MIRMSHAFPWFVATSIALAALGLAAGCSSSNKKPPKLADAAPAAPVTIAWRTNTGDAALGFAPAIAGNAIYVASRGGQITRLDVETGRALWRISANSPLSAGPGADATMIAVGTPAGEVLAFDTDGNPLWRVKASSEIIAPPTVADGLVVVQTADNRTHGLDGGDGSAKWMVQRNVPPLIVRNTQGAVTSRGGLFFGTAGGRLIAIDLASGEVAWDVAVATPKGTTELERIADVTSRPLIEEGHICAAAFQGRIACFEIMQGALLWTRDIPSYSGIAADDAHLYVSDDKGVVHALEKQTGASIWKNDLLSSRWPSGPQFIGRDIGVVDIDGYLHVFAAEDGKYLGRLPTDGTPVTVQPQLDGNQMIWLSKAGNVYAVVPR
ncbi:MAG: outer membrane protein assembly factor BamB [Burkholderiales bacterium]|jgi:outer membrane protein assembly factor BamB|nr:outer membrane protein assembly factor BamB [Burkholderiales bacterium]